VLELESSNVAVNGRFSAEQRCVSQAKAREKTKGKATDEDDSSDKNNYED
jgi:hypothetical protein